MQKLTLDPNSNSPRKMIAHETQIDGAGKAGAGVRLAFVENERTVASRSGENGRPAGGDVMALAAQSPMAGVSRTTAFRPDASGGENSEAAIEIILGARRDDGQPSNESNPLQADEHATAPLAHCARAPFEFQNVTIATVESGRSVVENEASPRFENDFAGGHKSGSSGPGRERSGEQVDSDHATFTDGAGPTQSEQPAGSRASFDAAADNFSMWSEFEPGDTSPRPSPHFAPTTPQNAEREKAISDADIKVATYRLNVITAFRELKKKHETNERAARKCGEPYLTIWRWSKAHDADGFDGLMPQNKNSGRKPKHRFTAQQAADVKSLVLDTNRNETSGSVPEAVRAAIKRGLLDYATVQLIQARFAAGVHPLPPAMREQVRVDAMTTKAYRAPRNTWLNALQSPGSLHLVLDEETGMEREIEPCERGTMDDGTINFVCNVPFNLPGNKCSENFGVMCGRFQFILPVDHRSRFIPGFNYTARPRSSYRAEDLTATLHTIFAEHGYWREMVLEHDVSAANLVTATLDNLGIKIVRASSPHQKVVESVFNRLWTKLSLMPGQVGRFRGEEEEVQALLISCQRGATDPRKHFPMLADVLQAIRSAIVEHNSQLVKSRQYGRWVPRELWDRYKKNLRVLQPEQAWMFAPVIAERKVRGFIVRVSVRLMEGYSEVFDFTADFLGNFDGAQVKVYFNPFAPECIATIVLAENFNGKKAGAILGHAEQVNRITRFRRRAFGYGLDPDIGLDATRRNAQALSRSVVAIKSDGSTGAQTHEARNGVGEGETASTLAAPEIKAAITPQQRLQQRAAGVSDDEFTRQAAKLARDEVRAAARKNLVVSVDD